MTEKIILLTIKVKIEIPEDKDIDDVISDLDYEITSDIGSITYTELTDREIIK